MGTRRFGAFFVAICWPLAGIYVMASDYATADPVAETRVVEVQIAQVAPASKSSTNRTATSTKNTAPMKPQANGRAAKPREPKQAMKMKKGPMGEMEIPSEVLFKLGSAELRPEATNVLAECAEMIRRDGNKNMRVIGHTDSTGPAAVNLSLSKRRAQVVTDWLVKEGGIPKEELTAIGAGANKPKASNDTFSGRAQNRRVEVVMPMGGSPHQPMTEEMMMKGPMGEMEIPSEVLFKLGSAELRPEATNVLAECAEMIRRDGNKNMRVIGHTDSTGPAAVNLSLSKRRAQVVTDWLVKEGGIPKEELTAIGAGANKPKASNDTPSGRAQNRRVEVVMPMGGSPHQPMTEEKK